MTWSAYHFIPVTACICHWKHYYLRLDCTSVHFVEWHWNCWAGIFCPDWKVPLFCRAESNGWNSRVAILCLEISEKIPYKTSHKNPQVFEQYLKKAIHSRSCYLGTLESENNTATLAFLCSLEFSWGCTDVFISDVLCFSSLFFKSAFLDDHEKFETEIHDSHWSLSHEFRFWNW